MADADPPERPGPSRADRAEHALSQFAVCARGALVLATYSNSSITTIVVIELLALGLQLAAGLLRRR
mgnify:CR=1 FL=1